MRRKKISENYGFSLVELMFVVTVLAIISTLVAVNLNSARIKTRDTQRVHDIQEIRSALETYYNRYASYPTAITAGQTFSVSNTMYLDPVPSNPTPKNDKSCGNNNYTYAPTSDNRDYSLNFCLGDATGSASAGINSASSADLGTAPGLIGWWKFDEGTGTKIYDSTVNKNDATWSGSGVHYATGKSSLYAGQYNGIDDIASTSNFSVPLYATHTISFWMKIVTYSAYGAIPIYSADSGGSKSFVQVHNNVAYGGNVSGYVSFTMAAYHNDNTWRHYVFVFDGENSQAKLYINGSQSGSTATYSTKVSNNPKKIFFGQYTSYPWNLNGNLDDVRIYNRALSAAEITALYNASAN
jgi:prepilin-type N-terminal cleavage/methylation domain-containing protein